MCNVPICEGLPNTSGLLVRHSVTSAQDADVIACMKRAGAIPLALTNCSELCMWYESSNLIYGRTNNAYHRGHIVGGSSGYTLVLFHTLTCQVNSAWPSLCGYVQ